MPNVINFCISYNSTIGPQKSEAAIWQSLFFFGWRKLAKAALLTDSLAESGLATKDVFHPQWLRCYLQEAATFPYQAPDEALCHSTVYHYQSLRIQGFFPNRELFEMQHITFIATQSQSNWTVFRFSPCHWNEEKRVVYFFNYLAQVLNLDI